MSNDRNSPYMVRVERLYQHNMLRYISFSDSAVKQILLTMNEKQSFIIEDLDDFHLVIKADEEYRVKRELETEVSSLITYEFF